MREEHVQFWQKTFKTCEQYMAPKHELWRRLISQYKLEFRIAGMKKSRIQKVSRFYPLTRLIVTSTAFNYPKVLMRVEDNNRQMGAEIIERVANEALDMMNVKPHVQQAIFDSLYCYLGILKCGVNPVGDNDLMPPYVANDAMQNGMVCWQRVSPFNFFIDPLTPPHNFGEARFVWEKMLVPYEFVLKDRRFDKNQINKIEPLGEKEAENEILEEMQQRNFGSEDEESAFRDAKSQGKYVILREVHDRIHKRQYTFADGVTQPIEDRSHPFLAGESEVAPDPITGQQRLTGNFRPTGGYLVKNGFNYATLAFDLSHDEFYGLPMMAYAEDTQKGIVESLSRRTGLLKRGSRIILGRKDEQKENPELGEDIENGKDLSLVWVQDVHNSFAELQQGNPPPDQLGIESDFRNYEEQILNVSQLQAGGGPRRTATEASLMASFGQLNREWMQSKVVDFYDAIIHNTLRIMGDVRYTPENFLINVAESEQDAVYEAVRSDMLQTRFKIHIETGSMKPLFEQLEREDTLALFNYLIQMPEIPRMESIKMLLRAFKVPNVEKFIGQASRWDAMRTAETENELMVQWAISGQPKPAPVQPQDDHIGHIPAHQKLEQGSALFQQLPPQLQAVVLQTRDAHIQQHQQLHQQKAGAGAAKPPPGGGEERISPLSDEGGATNTIARATGGVESAVRSAAQEISQDIVTNRDQN